MFCPVCRDEFRPGFTRCASCDVDLVEDLGSSALDAGAAAHAERSKAEGPSFVPMAEYCGFRALADAREAWDALRRAKIRGEIVIRESPEREGAEEYWLRVERARYQQAETLLGHEAAVAQEPADAEAAGFTCGDCGGTVGDDDTVCPGCGARFEDA